MSESTAPPASRLPALGFRLAGWALLAAALATWCWLALGPLFVGPSDWDDTMYAERAITKGFVWDVRNRYVHVWAIRLLDSIAPSHRMAAAAWGALCVCGMAALAFYAGKRMAGVSCGVLALLLTVMYPPLLKYLSVPHVDFTMALFSMLSVLAAVLAVESSHSGVARAAALASGVFGYWALKSKETGLVVPPLTAYILFHGSTLRAKWRVYAVWLLGLALGFAALFALDLAFVKDAKHRPSDPTIYFAPPPPAAHEAATPEAEAKPRPRVVREAEVIEQLMDPAFFGFSALGLAGFARAGRRNLWARALGLWGLLVLAFTAGISFVSHTVDAQDRYLIAVGAAFAPLAAAAVIGLFRAPREHAPGTLPMLALLCALVPLGAWGLWGVHGGDASYAQLRAAQVVLPLAMLLLFLAAWFTPRRFVAAPAALILLGLSSLVSLDQARAHRDLKRHELEPWTTLSQMVDDTPQARIAVLHGRSYRATRLRWRLRLFSRHPLLEIGLRDIDNADQAEPGEWVFVGAMQDRALEAKNYRRALALENDPRPWSLYIVEPKP